MVNGSYHGSCSCRSKVDKMERPHYFLRIRGLVEQPSNHIRLSCNVTGEHSGIQRGRRTIVQGALLLAMRASAGFLCVVYLNNSPWAHGID